MINFENLTEYCNVVLLEYRHYNNSNPLWETDVLSVSSAKIYHITETLSYDNPVEVVSVVTATPDTQGDFLLLLQLTAGTDTLEGLSAIPSLYRVISIGSDIEYIGNRCFRNSVDLIEVNIGETVHSIADDAFDGCSSFIKLYYSGQAFNVISSGAFTNCPFGTINIPDCVTTIASGAFAGCTNLIEIDIPDSVTTIAAKAFDGCTSLQRVSIGSGANLISEQAFHKCDNINTITIHANNTNYFDGGINGIIKRNYSGSDSGLIYGNGNTSIGSVSSQANLRVIGKSAYADCANVISLDLTNTIIHTIDESAFSGCSRLAYIDVPTTLANINKEAFNGCASLVGKQTLGSFQFKNSRDRTIIGDKAFYGCKALAGLDFGGNIGNIGLNAFGNCSQLSTITSSSSYNTLNNGYYVDGTAIYSVGSNRQLTVVVGTANTSLNNVNIVQIGACAFYGCTRRTSVSLVNTSVNKVGENAFYGCTGLASAILATATTGIKIGLSKGAFYGCTNLGLLTLTGVESINEDAFGGCTGLLNIDIPNICNSISDTAFSGCNNLLYINVDSGNLSYETANTTNGLNAIIDKNTKKAILSTLNSTIINNTVTTDYDNIVNEFGAKSCTKRVDNSTYSMTTIKPYISKIEKSAFEGSELKQDIEIQANTSGTTFTYTPSGNMLVNNQYYQPTISPRYYITYPSNNAWTTSLSVFCFRDYRTFINSTTRLNPNISLSTDATSQKVTVCEVLYNDDEHTYTYNPIAEYYYVPNAGGNNIVRKTVGSVDGHYYDNDGVSHWTAIPVSEQVTETIYTYPNYIYVDASDPLNLFYGRQDWFTDMPADMYVRSGIEGYTYGIQICDNAFAGATGVIGVSIKRPLINPGVGIFSGNTHLYSVTLGVVEADGTLSTGFNDAIPEKTFMGCTNLPKLSPNQGYSPVFNDVTFPRYIGKSAFEKCGLTSEGWQPFGKYSRVFEDRSFFEAFGARVSLNFQRPERIGENAFGNVDITHITIPSAGNVYYSMVNNGVMEIGTKDFVLVARDTNYWSCHGVYSYAGYGRTLDNNLEFGTSLMTIGDSAFENAILTTANRKVEFPGVNTIIGKNSFAKSNIKSLIISNTDSNIEIGEGSFSGCTSLDEFDNTKVKKVGKLAFKGCTNLTSLDLTVTGEVKDYAFDGCTGLTSVNYSGTDNIGMGMFANCPNITTITVPSNNDSCTSKNASGVNVNAIFGTEALENTLITGCVGTTIPSYYKHNTTGELIKLTTIGNGAFEGSSVTQVILPSTVTKLQANAFASCTSLTEVELSDNLTQIGAAAFKGCTNLTYIRIPKSVSTIEANAFAGCTSLSLINIESTNEENIDILSAGAFKNCSSLRNMIPTSCDAIPDYCYYKCSNLEEIIIPDFTTSIGDMAFYGCNNASTLVIESNMGFIGRTAFYGCSNLATVYVYALTNCTIQDDSFSGCGSNVSSTNKFVYGVSQDDPIVREFIRLGYQYATA